MNARLISTLWIACVLLALQTLFQKWTWTRSTREWRLFTHDQSYDVQGLMDLFSPYDETRPSQTPSILPNRTQLVDRKFIDHATPKLPTPPLAFDSSSQETTTHEEMILPPLNTQEASVQTSSSFLLLSEPRFFVTIEGVGRLGNLLFELASLHGIAYSEHKTWCINGSTTQWKMLFDAVEFIEHPGECPDFSNALERRESNWCDFDSTLIGLGNINVKYSMYLQSFKYFAPTIPFQLKHMSDAKTWTRAHNITAVVHVRRTDYLKEPMFGGVAPLHYYEHAVALIMNKHLLKQTNFVVCGDDQEWIRKQPVFNLMYVWQDVPAFDMAIIAACTHVVMGVGSFAWWGAFMREKEVAGDVIAYDNERRERADYFPSNWTILNAQLERVNNNVRSADNH
jgi:hypothetical protein